MKKIIAKAIKRAAEIKEKSWVEAERRYLIDNMHACKQAFEEFDLEEDLWYPFYLCFHWWNDILQWADDVLAGKKLNEPSSVV